MVKTMLLIVAVAACKPQQPQQPQQPGPVAPATGNDRITVQEAMTKIEGFKADMCRCKAGDKACAEQVEQAMKSYADSVKNKMPDPQSISPDDEQAIMETLSEMAKCQQAAMGTDATGAP